MIRGDALWVDALWVDALWERTCARLLSTGGLWDWAKGNRAHARSRMGYYSFRRRSIAASRVASFFAKHSRARRWPGGGVS